MAKRFKITGTGKVMRSRAGKRHLLQTKNAKRRRGLGGMVLSVTTMPDRKSTRLNSSHG